MGNLKHTKGPWKSTPFSSVVGCVITAQPDKTKNQFNICSVMGGASTEELKANAKLIAAAPEMLEALLRLKEFAERPEEPSFDEQIKLDAFIEATILKATE